MFARNTVHVNADLFSEYKDLPVLGGNLKPYLQPPWNQQDLTSFWEHLSTLEPQTIRWPGAGASNYFDWYKGTLLPCYKWSGISYPYDHAELYCGNNFYLCVVDTIHQTPRSIQPETLQQINRKKNYVKNYASNYVQSLQALRQDIDNEPLIPLFTLNVCSPEYYDPDSVEFNENCELVNPVLVNTISQQLDSIAILTAGMSEVFVQLGNEPYVNANFNSYKEAVWPNASAYFMSMISIAEQIDEHPGLQYAKVGLFADVHSDDIEDDGCTSDSSFFSLSTFRCTWNDSMHIILSRENAYSLFDAYTIQKYTGLSNMRIPDSFDEDCQPIQPINWVNKRITADDLSSIDSLSISNLSNCEMSYLIKWMIISLNNTFDIFAGDNYYYSGLYNSINGSEPKDIWITEYALGLDGTEAYKRTYSNGWPHALYNLYITMKYITNVPSIKVLIQNNVVGFSGGYRLIDTYSYVDDDSGTNNATYHWEDENFTNRVSHKFLGLSPKGETMRLLNQLAWRNNEVAEINFDPSEVDSTEIRRYNQNISYYAKDLYGWAFDQGDFLFMNISNDTLSVALGCSAYDVTIIEGDYFARNYQTETGTSLVYDTLSHHQVTSWEFDNYISPETLDTSAYFAASHAMRRNTTQIQPNNYDPTFVEIPPFSVAQLLAETGPMILGDLNFDCIVNVQDVILTVSFALGTMDPTMEEFTAADINADGVINVFDVIQVINIALERDSEKTDNAGSADIQVSGGKVTLFSESKVAGIQLQISQGNIQFLVHNGWEFVEHEGKILIYSMEGITKTGVVDLFTVDGDFDILDALVSNHNGEPMEITINKIPTKFALQQNYPNPFNPITEINYQLPTETDVHLTIYDLQGRLVSVLVDGTTKAGFHEIEWNSQNTFGHLVSSGVYFYRLATPEFTDVKKMVLLR